MALSIASFVIDHLSAERLLEYLLQRGISTALSDRIVLIAKANALIVTYYANVIVFVANLLLALAVFPIIYGFWVIIIFYVIFMLIIQELGWLSQYEAIDITDELPAVELPWLGRVSIEMWLRWEPVAFGLFTVAYFYVGYRLA